MALAAPQTALVRLVDAGCCLVRDVHRLVREVTGYDELVLRLGYLGSDDVGLEELGVQIELCHDGLHQTLLIIGIIDGEGARVSELLSVLTQDAHAHAMEGGDPHSPGLSPDERGEALTHLSGSLVGECDSQYLPGVGYLRVYHVRDAIGEHPGLA